MADAKADFQPSDPEASNVHTQSSIDEKTSDKPSETFGPAPDGGLKAWSVAIGGACTTFSTLGFANSFGVLQEYYAAHQLSSESADRIAWIGSLSAFLQFAAGAIAGPLFDRYGAWVGFFVTYHICRALTAPRSSGPQQSSTSSP